MARTRVVAKADNATAYKTLSNMLGKLDNGEMSHQDCTAAAKIGNVLIKQLAYEATTAQMQLEWGSALKIRRIED